MPSWLDPYDFELPPARIAQHALAQRDQSRLMVLRRGRSGAEHHRFCDLPDLLPAGAVLVVNNTRVLPTRLLGATDAGRAVEVLLVEPLLVEPLPVESRDAQRWAALVKPARKLKPGQRLLLGDGQIEARAVERTPEGGWLLDFAHPETLRERLEAHGLAPLPPYIRRKDSARCTPDAAAGAQRREAHRLEDREAYQTVYAKEDGAIAAPTAGLHFTPALLERLRAAGVPLIELTLHVGLGTFAPIQAETPEGHAMHSERMRIGPAAARALLEARQAKRPVIAVGTTTVRCLETWARRGFMPGEDGATDLFIRPPFEFQVTDGILTNFHLPRSTLLMLVAAFHGRKRVLEAYAEAVRQDYRFFSFGDCMAIFPASVQSDRS